MNTIKLHKNTITYFNNKPMNVTTKLLNTVIRAMNIINERGDSHT